MGNQRIFLWVLLGLVLWFTYQAWMKDYGSPPAPATGSNPAASTGTASSAAQVPADKRLDQTVPALPSVSGSSSAATPSAAAPAIPAAGSIFQPEVRVVTDVLDLDIGLEGGTLKRADLLRYPKNKKDPNVLVRLFEDEPGQPPFVLQSGLTAGIAGAQPDHLASFSAPAQDYRLSEGQDELKVPLTWSNGEGVTVTKTFTFKRGSYAIGVDYDINNQSQSEWHAAPYVQFLRHQEEADYSMFNPVSYAFTGPAIWDGTKYRKLNIENEEDGQFAAMVQDGWLAAMQHHFVAAAVLTSGQPYQFQLQVKDRDFLLSAVGPTQTVPAGAQQRLSDKVFVGPKLQVQLETLHPELDRTADYGHLTILSRPLFQLLEWVHAVVGNWGWAIVFVTFLLKLLFYPLSETSGRSMAKMKNLAPRIKAIQERYKDDREQLGRQMMEIYKREKINPLAGCLPMIIQIPVFLAFYWVLVESVEMRQAPFLLWINDLSSKDPFFILPAIMAAAMFVQYKLNPAPADPVQAKIFMILPLVMSVTFAFFPAGLVLYWVTNTVLSILQQWNINRRIEAAKKS